MWLVVGETRSPLVVLLPVVGVVGSEMKMVTVVVLGTAADEQCVAWVVVLGAVC